MFWRGVVLLVLALASTGCDRAEQPAASVAVRDEPSPSFRNVDAPTAYVGDSACASCHATEASVYRQHYMSQSFHKWAPGTRVETPLDKPLLNTASGYSYSVVDDKGQLYQVERAIGVGASRTHELRRRMDYVMGSGHVARTYFTEENGRLFQLPLTWYRDHGWDFSPGYATSNGRFDRVLPDRCIACHSSYPKPAPYLEGKYAELRPGIGCERCHGPGALHVKERTTAVHRDSAFDRTIVNPARLPLERRMDVCEQCHVHTAVSVPREGKDAFSYMPSQPLRDQWAFFKVSGGIDIVSHADRLRQSKCFIATRNTARPLECATCHNPHQPPPVQQARNLPCQSCHNSAALEKRLASSASLKDHAASSDCVSCHMPKVQERAVPHGSFTEHWIRVASRAPTKPTAATTFGNGLIEPFFERDKTGTEAEVYRGMGGILYATLNTNGGVLSEAAAALDRALGGDTTRGDANFLLGVAYQQLGKTDDAIRALEPAVRSDSNRPDRLRALAQEYERAGRAPADISHLYQRALAQQPALAWVRADYATWLQSQGMRTDAEKAYRAAVAEQPSLTTAWFNLGTLLAEEGKAGEATNAFRAAVHLDPSLAQALSPLIEVRTKGTVVTDVRGVASALTAATSQLMFPGAVQLTVASGNGSHGIAFLNVPPRASVRILKPDGTLVRALPASDGSPLNWDLLGDTGNPVGGGLYRAQILKRDASGRPSTQQFLYLGVVRRPE
ncbi:MAG: tetratricopeptide repeat protein [bacterium]